MTHLFLAPDWRSELCLWQATDHPDRPRLVHRASDLDPLAWAIVVLAVAPGQRVAS